MRLSLIITFLFLRVAASGNNLEIKDASFQGNNKVRFTISWENSFRFDSSVTPGNHDAVWIFLKYNDPSSGWVHLDISPDDTSHSSAFFDIYPAGDRKGVFLVRKDTGVGKSDSGDIVLRLVNSLNEQDPNIRIFGIEMVYVPRGGYYLGDAAGNHSFIDASSGEPYHVYSEGKVISGTGGISTTDSLAPHYDIPASFPKGYTGFYLMKYEITQKQYSDFLNTLSYNQQVERTAVSPASSSGTFALSKGGSHKNGIVIYTPGSFSTPAVYGCNFSDDQIINSGNDGQHKACNFLSWNDLAAYLDWAALRPFTELEYEKACRGPLTPVKKEYAWGTNKVIDANTIEKEGTSEEKSLENFTTDAGIASHGYSGPQGPLRSGFAGNPQNNRRANGASYYGIFELSGNLWEICINVNRKGLLFTGLEGDGKLNNQGDADVSGWPGNNGNGAGFRGGGWNSGIIPGFRDLAVSDRFYAFDKPTTRRETIGGRGARSR